jgi:hypothetical protein
MTLAEMVVLVVVLLVLVWLLRPLQHWVRDGIERVFLRRRYGKVIEGRFRSVKGDEEPPPETPKKDEPGGDQP